MKKVIFAIEMMWLLLGTAVFAINLEAQSTTTNRYMECDPSGCSMNATATPTQGSYPNPAGGPYGFALNKESILKISKETRQQTKVVKLVWSIPVNGKVEQLVENLTLSVRDQAIVPSAEVANQIGHLASGSTFNVSVSGSGRRPLKGSFSVADGKISAKQKSQLRVVALQQAPASSQ